MVKEMGNGEYRMGAALDGGGDRNIILGQNAFFITSGVVDRVTEKRGFECLARRLPAPAQTM